MARTLMSAVCASLTSAYCYCALQNQYRKLNQLQVTRREYNLSDPLSKRMVRPTYIDKRLLRHAGYDSGDAWINASHDNALQIRM